MIRTFFRATFPKILDVLFMVSAVGIVFAAFSFSPPIQYVEFATVAKIFLTILIGGLVSIVLFFGVIYALLDIRDSLEISEKK